MEKTMKKAIKNKKRPYFRIAAAIPGGILLTLAGIVYAISKWLDRTYNMEFSALLHTLISPIKGTGGGVVEEIVAECIPSIVICVIVYAIVVYVLCQTKVNVTLTANVRRKERRIDVLKWIRRVLPLVCIAALLSSLMFCYDVLGIAEWRDAQNQVTTIYEDHYVFPNSVSITEREEPKNIIYIYVESFETTYASKAVGGSQPVDNYVPYATKLALSKDTVSFSNNDRLGGFYVVPGAEWTMAAILSTTSGLPFAFPTARNSLGKHEKFASGVTSLGEILEERGYTNEFLCGSDGDFAGRKDYFVQHGNYEIFDYFTAIEKGYIDSDHKVWWGYEDYILYDIAKDEVTRLAEGDQPFNFTFLTVDQHSKGGYVCPVCGDDYEVPLANVLLCGDKLLEDFVEWCKKQDFYEDTIIVITGDHPRMDTFLIDDTVERPIYNCFLNTGLEPALSQKNRTFTAQDIFPTVLYAMGFDIEGNRLGLGTNLFSDVPTLTEELGLEYYRDELAKSSLYYIATFS